MSHHNTIKKTIHTKHLEIAIISLRINKVHTFFEFLKLKKNKNENRKKNQLSNKSRI